jgi:hypothetical protein
MEIRSLGLTRYTVFSRVNGQTVFVCSDGVLTVARVFPGRWGAPQHDKSSFSLSTGSLNSIVRKAKFLDDGVRENDFVTIYREIGASPSQAAGNTEGVDSSKGTARLQTL